MVKLRLVKSIPLCNQVLICYQSLWSGPGPSPLERLLEQKKYSSVPKWKRGCDMLETGLWMSHRCPLLGLRQRILVEACSAELQLNVRSLMCPTVVYPQCCWRGLEGWGCRTAVVLFWLLGQIKVELYICRSEEIEDSPIDGNSLTFISLHFRSICCNWEASLTFLCVYYFHIYSAHPNVVQSF